MEVTKQQNANIVTRAAALNCFVNSIRLDVRCGKRVPVDTNCGLIWVCNEADIRVGDTLEAWNGYEWSRVAEHTLLALADVENFTMEAALEPDDPDHRRLYMVNGRKFQFEDDEFYEDVQRFADPGGKSALYAETLDNPRVYPCPECQRPNRLTKRDIQSHYICDSCADRAEAGW